MNAVQELAATILDTAHEGEVLEHLRAWAQVVRGHVTSETRVVVGEGARRYDETALRLASTGGGVTSGELGKIVGVTSECARQVLVRLASEGKLLRHGLAKGTFYTTPGGYHHLTPTGLQSA